MYSHTHTDTHAYIPEVIFYKTVVKFPDVRKKIDSQTILSEYVAVACLTATFKTSERS